MKHPALFLVFLSIALLSCRKKETPDPVPHLNAVVGNYEWTKTAKRIQEYSVPPVYEKVVASDSSDRYGICVQNDRTITFIKNQEIVTQVQMLSTSMDANGVIVVSYKPDQAAKQQEFRIKDGQLNSLFYPFESVISGSGYWLSCDNELKKTNDVASLPFVHTIPCEILCNDCGSYTGYLLKYSPDSVSYDTLFYGLATFHVVSNPYACEKYITKSNGDYYGPLTGTHWYERYISADSLYIREYIYFGYNESVQKISADFVGKKD